MSDTGVLTSAGAVNPLGPGERLLVVGGGYTGQRFAECLRQLGADVVVTHRRTPSAAGELPFDSSTGLLPTAAEPKESAICWSQRLLIAKGRTLA